MKARTKPPFQLTEYGFEWGSLEVSRICSEDGWVVLGLKTPKKSFQVYVTKTGKTTITEEDT
jgi:hypothetical protein